MGGAGGKWEGDKDIGLCCKLRGGGWGGGGAEWVAKNLEQPTDLSLLCSPRQGNGLTDL